MLTNRPGCGRLLSQRTKEGDRAKAESGHGQGCPDPGQGGPVECELSSEAGQARSFSRQIHARINWINSFLAHTRSPSRFEICRKATLSLTFCTLLGLDDSSFFHLAVTI